MDRNKHVAYWTRYALIAVFTVLSMTTHIIAQNVDLTLVSNYTNLPPIESQSVRNSNKLYVTLTLNDFSYKQFDVRLHLSIKSNGIELSTYNSANFKIYTLIPGVPQVINAADLGDYFDVSSLTFNGVDKNDYLLNGMLPEGNYQLCFTALDARADGINPISNTDCDALSLQYIDAPEITSTISEAVTYRRLEWDSKTSASDEMNFEVQAFEYRGGETTQAPIFQLPFGTIPADDKSVDITSLVKQFDTEKLYILYIYAQSKRGYTHVIKNSGYSHGLLFEKQANAEDDCVDNPVLMHDIYTSPNGNQYIHFTMEGCEPINNGYLNFPYMTPYLYPYDPNTGYSIRMACTDGCVYDFEYGDQNCVVGKHCTTENGCEGRIDYGCICKQWCTSIELVPSLVNGQRVLVPDLPSGCDNPQYEWSDGSTSPTIPFNDVDDTYSVEITCASGCTYCGIINSRGCLIGKWCNDGDPCTINDRTDVDCNCVGDPIDHCDSDDPEDTGGCASNLEIELTQSGDIYFLSASIDCTPVEYIWNGDETLSSPEIILSSPNGNYTLDVLCADGCSYTASIDLSCTQGAPCDDDNDPSTIEYYNEVCECVTYPCPDTDGDGQPDDCDDNQPCTGSANIIHDATNELLTVDLVEVECPEDVSYIWSNGATSASIPYTNTSATYLVTVTCPTGCQYTDEYVGDTDDDCIVGEPCTNTSCFGVGVIDDNCDCISVNPAFDFSTEFEILDYGLQQGTVTVTMSVDSESCPDPNYKWSTGDTGASVEIMNPDATYSVTVTCGNCFFVAYYNLDNQDCIIGAPCSDGDPCTEYDTVDDNCDCVGTVYTGDNPEDCTDGPCDDGVICDDGNPCTYFDVIYSDACCIGFYIGGNSSDDCSDDPCIVGASCNDNNPCTIDDVYDADCNCSGTLLTDSNGDPLTDCDETNPCTLTTYVTISTTPNYNEVVLSAQIEECDADVSYLWSNGSTSQNIVVNPQTGTYSVVISCGDCSYTAYYDTDGCLVGLPCNDGLDCTENDIVQENCECVGENVDDITITFSTEEIYDTSCSQTVCLPTIVLSNNFYINEIVIELSSGEIVELNKGLNTQGFDFPYCISYALNGTPAVCDGLPSLNQLVSHINTWLAGNGTVSLDLNTLGPDSNCDAELHVNNSTYNFLSYSGYTDMIPLATYDFSDPDDCQSGSLAGINIIATHDCEPASSDSDLTETISWSDGTQGVTTFIPAQYINNVCLEVSVTCTNGCTYTAIYGDQCDGCIVGATCDDGNPCTINDVVTLDCGCVGDLLSDSDNDGICDQEDDCPGGNDNVDVDQDGIPDACDPEVGCDEFSVFPATASIDETITYCTYLNDPFFYMSDTDITLNSFTGLGALGPATIDESTAGFHFPYTLVGNSPKVLPSSFFTDMAAYLGEEFTFGMDTGDPVNIQACIPTIDTYDEDGNPITILDPIEGTLVYAMASAPSVPLNFEFGFGYDNIPFTKSFNNYADQQDPFPYLLSILPYDLCGGDATYQWSTGETVGSIYVPSLAGEYSVIVTCGDCSITEVFNAGGCTVGSSCTFTDECGDTHPGTIDAYCNCQPDEDIILLDTDQDGILDCNELPCDDEEIQTLPDGEQICCTAELPKLIHNTEPVIKEVRSFCTDVPEGIITEITFYLDGAGTIVLNANNNDGSNSTNDDSGNGNFFHFPYCVESNCNFFGDNIDIPYNLKNIKSLAYDLTRWASFHDYDITPSTIYDSNNCTMCDQEGNAAMFYFYNTDIVIDGEQVVISKIIFKFKNDAVESFAYCEQDKEVGYTVKFDGNISCDVVSLQVKTNNNTETFDLASEVGTINLTDYTFGPVPHHGVGFRANIVCADGCEYNIETENADCIVGDSCDYNDPCITQSIIGYDNDDCTCITIVTGPDSDNDGVCDEEDECPGFDDKIDSDGDGIPDGCDHIVGCNISLCSYTVTLPQGICTPHTRCRVVENIRIENPEGIVIDLNKEPYFDFPYELSFYQACSELEDQRLRAHLMGWFALNGYSYSDINIDNGVISITYSEVKILEIKNHCGDLFEAEVDCLPPYCNYSAYKYFDGYDCLIYEDILVEIDNEEHLLSELYPAFNFPYCSNGNWEVCNENCRSIFKISSDFKDILNLTTKVDKESTPSWSSIGLIVSFSQIKFIEIISNQGLIPFNQSNCVSACDDGWDCTVNDQFDENCNCIGTFLDSDNDAVCDAEDQCHGYPDYIDLNENNFPDFCESGVTISCGNTNISICEYLGNVLSDENIGKVQMNNLVKLQERFKEKFENVDNILNFLPYPKLKRQIEKNKDCDQDGIVDILDPCPCIKAYDDDDFPNDPTLWGTHSDVQSILANCDENNCESECDMKIKEAYKLERARLLYNFLFTVIEGVNIFEVDGEEASIVSSCVTDSSLELDIDDVNDQGHVFDPESGCYVYFDIDCEGNCIVNYTADEDGNSNCSEPEVVGDICTTDPALENEAGYYFIQCPPADANPCIIYSIVPNPDYNPYNPQGEVPCDCQPQMTAGGLVSQVIDTDDDGFCDLIDQCPGEDDALDTDGDGIPDCKDLCPGLDGPISDIHTKEGYDPPTGPGDLCDDGNACTYDDVITADCECRGVYIDSDDDGVYDCEDCDFGSGTITQVAHVINGVVQKDENGQIIEIDKEIFDFGDNTVYVDNIGNEVAQGTEGARTLINCDVCPGIPDGDPTDIGGQYPGDLPMDYNDNGLPDCVDPPYYPIGCPYEINIVPGEGLVISFLGENIDVDELPNPIIISISGSSTGTGLYFNEYTILEYTRETVNDDEENVLEAYYSAPGINMDQENQSIIISYGDHQPCIFGNNPDPVAQDLCPTNVEFVNGQLVLTFNYSTDGINIDYTTVIGDYTLSYIDETGVSTSVPIGISDENTYFATNDIASFKVALPDFVLPDNYEITIPGGIICNYDGEELEAPCQGDLNKPCDDEKECTYNDKIILVNGNCICQGIDKPDTDSDGFCDELDPCPEFPNAQPTIEISGDQELNHLDIADCPCPALELSTLDSEIAGLENGNDFYAYFGSDLSGYSNITIEVDNGQDDPFDPTNGNGVEPVSPIVINNLTAGYIYTIKITVYCDNGAPQTASFDIDVPFGDSPILCGVELTPPDLNLFSLLPSMQTGEEFVASDFVVIVKSVTGSYGEYSGKGYISVPYFNAARLNVSFKNIKISDEREMIDGLIEVDSYGLAVLGDDISDAINGGIDGIIGVLEDLSDVLEELIPTLENIEKLIEESGHLVDDEIISCIEEAKAELEELKELAEASPAPTNDVLAQIKLDIETMTAELKVCIDQYNDQIEGVLNSILAFIPSSINFIHNNCSANMQEISNEYMDIKLQSQEFFSITIDNIVSKLLDDGIIEDFGGSSDLVQSNNFKRSQLSELSPDSDLETDIVIDYFEKQSKYDLCTAIPFLKTHLENNNLSLTQVESVLQLFTNYGTDLASIVGPELKSGELSHQEIFDKYQSEIERSFSSIIINFTY